MRPPWLKKLKRIIGRRLRSGSLSTEAARQLCDEVLPSIQRRSPPPAVSAAADVSRADHRPSWELEQFVGECYCSGDLGTKDALNLFDELLPQARTSSIYALDQLLTTVARAPVSSTVRDGPALAVSMFNRMAQAGAKKVAPDIATYTILIACCCDAGCLNLGFAALGQIIKMRLRADAMTFTPMLRTLCAEKRTSDAVNIVVRRMPEPGCTPNVFSYTTLLKGLCAEKKCEDAVDLIHMMAEDGDNCPPNVVSYTTVVHGFFKEGEVGKAYTLFREMLDHGILPNVVTCNSIIDGLCKVHAMDKAEEVLRQMIDEHIIPNCATYNSLVYGYLSLGQWKEAVRILKQMSRYGKRPDVVTYNMLIDYLCKSGLHVEARDL
jgi:pentatricopeptide repeat protein